MRNMGLNEIREKYLSFFESKGHLRMQSFSLVPQNDPSILLINAGMTPLKPYFTGAEEPPRKRVTTCQKCIRTPDIDNVGKTARHGTFFEMLGNFSFGDYFKKEVIPWAWEFMTEVMEIPADKLYVTIYLDDDEAYEIWTKDVGVPDSHIFRMGKEDNFWEHGTGPCGPCSEIHFDRGEKYGCGKPDCKVGCDCDRFMEVWNLVFTQFDRKADGSYERLAFPNIDTGMGLERLACVMQNVDNLFEVDTVRRVLDTVCDWSGVKYGVEWKNDVSIRVITDHIRSTVMMVSDGVVPSNGGRGYVLRRLLRGAARHGRMLGLNKPFLSDLAQVVIEESGGAYPNLVEKADYIKKVISIEEASFASTIDQGMALLSTIIEDAKSEGKTEVSGEAAFRLHDIYGFPFDLTKEIAAENGFSIDEDGFRSAMKIQKETARASAKGKNSSWSGKEIEIPAECPATDFVGYETLNCDAEILYILKKDENAEEGQPSIVAVENANDGDEVIIITDKTPFYAESGGQAGDTGVIETASDSIIRVIGTEKTADKKWKHICVIESGMIEQGDKCVMKVDRAERLATERNHSATHLVQKALQKVLGDHVHQAGSSVNPERLRFDFNHMQAMTEDEIKQVEAIVNEAIYEDYIVNVQEMPIEEAKKIGAMALFGEKYGNVVRVVDMGGYSVEFCGGTHVKSTATIGLIKILHESAVAAGIRRIEAVTGNIARMYYAEKEQVLNETASALKATPADIKDRVAALSVQYKAAVKELSDIKKEMAAGDVDALILKAKTVNGITVVTGRFDLLEGEALRDMAEKLRDKIKTGIVVVASGANDKVQIVAMATKTAVESGVSCGKVIKQAAAMCGGGGGGRPDMAQAGGKNPEAIDEMLSKIDTML